MRRLVAPLVWAGLRSGLLVGCAGGHTHAGGVVVAADSRADRVVFLIPASPFLYGLTVSPCQSERPVWAVGSGGDSAPPPTRVVYGVVPAGFSERVVAQPLRPGCYRVTVSGPASAEFVVRADGSVRSASGAPAAPAAP